MTNNVQKNLEAYLATHKQAKIELDLACKKLDWDPNAFKIQVEQDPSDGLYFTMYNTKGFNGFSVNTLLRTLESVAQEQGFVLSEELDKQFNNTLDTMFGKETRVERPLLQ